MPDPRQSPCLASVLFCKGILTQCYLDLDRSEHTRRSLSEKAATVGEKDRQIIELQRQVAELQAKVGGSVGSAGIPPVVPADTRAGTWLLGGRHPLHPSAGVSRGTVRAEICMQQTLQKAEGIRMDVGAPPNSVQSGETTLGECQRAFLQHGMASADSNCSALSGS